MEKKEKTNTSQSSKHCIVLGYLLLLWLQAMRHGKGGEREERRERKERGGEEGEKKGLENPIGVTGVLVERAQGAHARPSTPRDLAPP